MNKEIAQKILEKLRVDYPEAKPALEFHNAFELLVAVILSAQCTDKRVNATTKVLFPEANTPAAFVAMPVERLEKLIYSCGFYHTKAAHIISASKSILENFNGQVPGSLEELRSLAGVGRKTANVVYAVAFHGQAIAVDTHVFRVSNRLGLAVSKDVLHTEYDLQAILEENVWSEAHHLLIFHGRQVCKSQNPNCSMCSVREFCTYYNRN